MPAQLLDDLGKELRRSGQIEKIVPPGSKLGINVRQPRCQAFVRMLVGKVATLIVEPFIEPSPGVAAVVFCFEKLCNLLAEDIFAQFIDGNADYSEVR